MSDAKVCHMCLMGGFQCQLCGRTLKAKHLARLERRAKDWAHNAVGNWSCNSCKRRDKNMSGPIVHAHDCDAAIILDLERESVG